MPRLDLYHHAVRRALIRDGWTITHDPLILPFGETDVYVDLGAEMPLAAERDGERIAVEVKTFGGRSGVADLEQALGQYRLYRFLLRQNDPARALYLAVTEEVFAATFDKSIVRDLMTSEDVRLLVFNPVAEEIQRWIP